MIIGLHGPNGSGKDTAGQIMADLLGYSTFALADQLRDIVYRSGAIVDGHLISDLVDSIGWDQAKRLYPEVRRTFQNVASAIRHVVSDDFFYGPMDTTRDVVVTDVRFQPEADLCDVVIGITGRGSADSPHLSDRGLTCAYQIDNSGDLANLEAEVKRVIGLIKPKYDPRESASMTREEFDEWLNALVSGGFRLGRRRLYTAADDSYDALGVLAELVSPGCLRQPIEGHPRGWTWGQAQGETRAPQCLTDRLSLATRREIVTANDYGKVSELIHLLRAMSDDGRITITEES